MKINVLSFVVSVAYLVARTAADVILDPFPDVVYIGETYTLNWTATGNYTYQLWLIRSVPQQTWQKVLVLTDNLNLNSLQGHYDWTVQSNLTVQGDYTLWLQGMVVPYNGHGYPNQTSTFNISSARDSTGAPSSGSHTGVSGGVIAGIVIGCVVLLALGIGGFLLFAWRKRRSAASRRQAAARATRLEPVVKESFPGYEMNGRS